MVSATKLCKCFSEAVKKKQYCWFYVCPNGGKDYHYKHALPPGQVSKSQKKALLDEEIEKISDKETGKISTEEEG